MSDESNTDIDKEKKEKLKKLYHQIYYQANKEELDEKRREYQREYRKKNRKRIAEYRRMYYQKNKEKLTKKAEEYRKKNLTIFNKNQKNYRKKNIEKQREYMREYMRRYRKEKADVVEKSLRDFYARKSTQWTDPASVLKLVKKNGLNIKKAKVITDEIKKAALKQNGKAIVYITEPTIEDYKNALSSDLDSIQWIENPSDEVFFHFIEVASNKPDAYNLLFWLSNHSKWKDTLSKPVRDELFNRLSKYIIGE